MSVKPVEELLILTLDYSEESMIAGRTLLQKTIYFIKTLLGLEVDFVPYLYGPYSYEVANALAALQRAGLVEESVRYYRSFNFGSVYESRLHTYRLSSGGKKLAAAIAKRNPELAENVRAALSKMKQFAQASDYRSLSIAAKMHHLLVEAGRPVTIGEICREAAEIGWTISEREAAEAVKFLEGIGLAEVKA